MAPTNVNAAHTASTFSFKAKPIHGLLVMAAIKLTKDRVRSEAPNVLQRETFPRQDATNLVWKRLSL